MFTRFILGLVVFSGFYWQAAAPAKAALIVDNTGGSSVTAFGGIFGHSFTTQPADHGKTFGLTLSTEATARSQLGDFML